MLIAFNIWSNCFLNRAWGHTTYCDIHTARRWLILNLYFFFFQFIFSFNNFLFFFCSEGGWHIHIITSESLDMICEWKFLVTKERRGRIWYKINQKTCRTKEFLVLPWCVYWYFFLEKEVKNKPEINQFLRELLVIRNTHFYNDENFAQHISNPKTQIPLKWKRNNK